MPSQNTGARRARSRGEHMLGPGVFLVTTPNKSTCLPEAKAPGERTHAESTCWGQDYFINHPKYKSTGARRAHSRGEHVLGQGFFLITPNKGTRLPKAQAPGEHAHAESTCLPKAQAPGEHKLGPGIFLLIALNKSTCLPKAQAPGEHARAESACWGQEFFF